MPSVQALVAGSDQVEQSVLAGHKQFDYDVGASGHTGSREKEGEHAGFGLNCFSQTYWYPREWRRAGG